MAVAAATAAAFATSSAPAAAKPPEAYPDAEVTRRLAFVETRLHRATPAATLYWSAWYYGYMLVCVGQAGVALGTTNRGLRTDSGVGAAFSSLGVLGIGVVDFVPMHAAASLRVLPATTPAERRRKLAHAERLLAASAAVEAGGRSWVAHVAGGALTLTSTLVLALVYKRVASSIVTLVSGIAITEASVFTRPTAAIDDWRAYQQGALGAGASTGGAPRATWSVVAQPGGLGVAAAF